MADDPRSGEPDEKEDEENPSAKPDADEPLLLAFASALLPIFFRRRR